MSILRISAGLPGLPLAQTLQVAPVDVALLAIVAPRRQRGPLLPALEGTEIVDVLVEQPQGRLPVAWRAVAGHDGVRALDQRPEARERRAVVGRRSAWVDHRNLHRREVVTDAQDAAPAGHHGQAVRSVALSRI